jgi:hypothetical protein
MADLAGFREYLESLGRAELTVQGYLQDMRDFARWFEGTNGVRASGRS